MWLQVGVVRPEERQRVAWMFLYYMGAVSATVIVARTVASSLFLHHLPVTALPFTYMGAAIAVAGSSIFYTRIVQGRRLDQVITTSCLIAASTCVGMRILLALLGHSFLLIGLMYFLVEVMLAVLLLQFWTFAGDLFTPGEGKRLFGIIGCGGSISGIVLGLVMRNFAESIGTANFLFISALMLMVCYVAVRKLSKDYLERMRTRKKPQTALVEGSDFQKILRMPLASSILFASCLATLSIALVDYQWKLSARATYTHNENALAAYFGAFCVAAGFIELFMQFFVTGFALRRFGVMTSLTIEPAYMLFGSVLILLSPGAGIALWSATIVRLYSVFRFSVSGAARQLLTQPIRDDFRPRFRGFIDGIATPLASGAIGIALFLVGDTIPPRYLSVAVIALLGGIFMVLWRVRRHYVAALSESIRRNHQSQASETVFIESESTELVRRWLASNDERNILRSLEVLQSSASREHQDLILPLLQSPSEWVRERALAYLERSGSKSAVEPIAACLSDAMPNVRAAAIRAIAALDKEDSVDRIVRFIDDMDAQVRRACIAGLINHGGLEGILAAAEQWKRMFDDPDSSVREAAAEILAELPTRYFHSLVRKLLSDTDGKVVRVASRAAGASKAPELITPLLANLERPQVARSGVLALADYGPAIIPTLSKAAATLSIPARCQLARVFGRIGGSDAVPPLLELAAADHEDVRDAAASALQRIARKGCRIDSLADVETAYDREIGRYFNDLAAWHALDEMAPKTAIAEALQYRLRRTSQRVLDLLAVVEPKLDMNAVHRGLASTCRKQMDCAIELIENVVDSRRRPALAMMLDRETPARKLEWAKTRYRLENRSASEWLNMLLQDPNDWIRATACHEIGVLRLEALIEPIRQLIDHGVDVVREAARAALERLAPTDQLALVALHSTHEEQSAAHLDAWK